MCLYIEEILCYFFLVQSDRRGHTGIPDTAASAIIIVSSITLHVFGVSALQSTIEPF